MAKKILDGQLVMGTPIKYDTWNPYSAQKNAPTYNKDSDKIRAEFE
ncbi:MAG: hypothetical protein U0K19_01570 [Bifidobacteriaceae bacterium]|nr:hypothetical protein [Bifidobacteriaceae bacterium]